MERNTSCVWNEPKRVTHLQLHSQHKTGRTQTQTQTRSKKSVWMTNCCHFTANLSLTSSSNHGRDIVQMQAMKEDPPADFKCKDKFLVQSVAITAERAGLSLAELVWNICGPVIMSTGTYVKNSLCLSPLSMLSPSLPHSPFPYSRLFWCHYLCPLLVFTCAVCDLNVELTVYFLHPCPE